MNTVGFIKKFGWYAINHDLSGYFKGGNIGKIQVLTKEKEYLEVNGDELKTLVESHDLVESYGGLEKAKLRCYPAKHLTMESYYKLKQAISDVESCK